MPGVRPQRRDENVSRFNVAVQLRGYVPDPNSLIQLFD